MCRETPRPGHVFVESLAEIDPRKVAEVMRRSPDKRQLLCDPFFALSPKPIERFRWKRARLSLFRPQLQLPSFIEIHPSFRDISENDLLDRYNNFFPPSGTPTVPRVKKYYYYY